MKSNIIYFKRFFFLSACSWLIYLISDSLSSYKLASFLPENSFAFLCASILLIASMLLTSLIFYLLIKVMPNSDFSLIDVYILHYIGQVLRYIPGRFWGFLYQLDSGKTAGQKSIITNSNIQLLSISVFGTSSIALFVLSWQSQIPVLLGYSLSICMLMLLVLVLRLGLSTVVFFLQKYLPASVYEYINSKILIQTYSLSFKHIAFIICFFCISWATYLFAWGYLSEAFPVLSDIDVNSIAAWYGLAWLIGFVSAITPSGIGVREASFLLLAAENTNSELLVFIAAFIRLWFLAADLVLGFLALILSVIRRYKNG